MPLAVRKIAAGKWKTADYSWVPPGSLQGDVLGDLKTGKGRLSLWEVRDDKANLDDVIVALTSAQERLDHFDYIIFDRAVIAGLGFSTTNSPGSTPFKPAQSMHFDVLDLTTSKLSDLAFAISKAG